MKLDYKSTRYTLDYDNTTYKRLLAKIFYILLDKNTKCLRFRKSPRKNGFHVEVKTKILVHVLKKRRKFRDDGRRIIHDILNRPDHIHDVLWCQKRIKGKLYKAGKWSKWIY